MTGGGIWSKKIQFYVGRGAVEYFVGFSGGNFFFGGGDFRKYVDKIYSETLVGKTRKNVQSKNAEIIQRNEEGENHRISSNLSTALYHQSLFPPTRPGIRGAYPSVHESG